MLLIVIFPLLIYVLKGAPPLSAEHGFRRAERENVVGPSRILGTEQIQSVYSDTLIVGETDYGVVLYTHSSREVDSVDHLSYYPRQGAVMVCAIPAHLSSLTPQGGDPLTVIVFDGHPEAVRAEVELQLFWEHAQTGQQYRYDYLLTGARTNPGYISVSCKLNWHNDSGFESHPEDNAIFQFCAHAWSEDYRAPEGEFPATVRLYDENDRLIHSETVYVFPFKETGSP